MHFSFRKFFFLLVLTCLSLPAFSKQVVLRVPDYPADTASDPWASADREGIRIFESMYPDIKIDRLQGISSLGAISDAPELMALAGGTAPDVLQVFVHKVQNYIDQGFCQPIEDYVNDPAHPWEGRHNMPDAFWPTVTRGKHVYAVVKAWYALELMYRKDLFAEAGLDPEKPPQTWDELYEDAQRLTFPDKMVANMTTNRRGQYGFLLPGGWQAGWQFPIWAWQAGGDVVEAYEADRQGRILKTWRPEEVAKLPAEQAERLKWHVIYDHPEAVRALEFWKKLKWGRWTRDGREYEGVISTQNNFDTGNDEFGYGKVAMKIYTTIWGIGNYGFTPTQIGIAPLPAGPGGRANYAAGDLYMINSSVKDPAVRDAAWKYIAYKTSDAFLKLRDKYIIQSNQYFLLQPDELQRFGFTSIFEKFPKSWVDTFKFAKENLHAETYAPEYQVVQTNELVLPVDKILTDKKADPYTELHKSAVRVNRVVYGERSPEQIRTQRRVAAGIFVVVVAALAWVVAWGLRQTGDDGKPMDQPAGRRSKRQWTNHLKVWGMLSLAVLSVFVWSYVPLIQGAVIAFQDYRLMGSSTWIWLDNFVELFTQPQFFQVVLNTIYYVILSMSLGFAAPIVLALLLTEVPRGKVLFRVLYYLPSVMAPLVISLMWVVLFSESPDGALNSFLDLFGIAPQRWLNDPSQAMICIVATGIWSGIGGGCLIYLAALKTIPEDIYDAADLDGCGIFQKVRYITLPYLWPLILINLLGAFIGSFHAAQNIFIMTQGGPGIATKTAGVDIFINAYIFLKYGLAISEAWVLGALLIGFTLYQLKFFQKAEFKTAGTTT
jgi:multiple sugar transport system permease protein